MIHTKHEVRQFLLTGYVCNNYEVVWYYPSQTFMCRSTVLWIGLANPIITVLFDIYFYLCLKSYAEVDDMVLMQGGDA